MRLHRHTMLGCTSPGGGVGLFGFSMGRRGSGEGKTICIHSAKRQHGLSSHEIIPCAMLVAAAQYF